MRSGPGTDYASKGSAAKDETFKIKSVKSGWGQIRSNGYWIKLKYAKIVSGYKVKISIDDLNMRTGPGTKYDTKGHIKPGTYELSKISGSWGKIKSKGYWVKLSYTKRVN